MEMAGERKIEGLTPVPECPVCQEPMEEITAYVTECCGAETVEGLDSCPLCGAENPLVVKRDPSFVCERCGFKET
jgi:predicted amidophosphoribosyltransferase